MATLKQAITELHRVSLTTFQILHNIRREQGLRRACAFARLSVSCAMRGKSLPHTVDIHRTLWSNYDWSAGGYEWSKSPEWEVGVVEHILKPNIPVGSRVLEVGPGAGRWTVFLLERASHVSLVDVTPKCIELCRERFKELRQIDYYLNDGSDLSFLAPGSIDRIWSWDVFVHLGMLEITRYLEQFATILTPGGRGVLHHAIRDRAQGLGWRTGLPAERMAQLLASHGLQVMEQFNSWNDRRDTPPEPPDLVTVFAKPIA